MTASKEFMRFAVVGAIGFVVDVVVLYLVAPLLGWYGARVVSFFAAATATWALNRRYTFAARAKGSVLREYLMYLATMLGGAAANYAVYVLVLHVMPGQFAPALGVAMGSCAGLLLNFASARYLIYKRHHHE